MKAMMLTSIHKMGMKNVSDPEIKNPTDVLLKPAAIGICGSDVHYYVSGRIGSQIIQYPFTAGHELSAIVEEVGPDVTRVKHGDRVFVDPAISCWKCDQCLSGRPHTCRSIGFLGCPGQADGCLSEYIVMPEECCFPIKEKTRLDHAAFAEPLSIGFYSIKQSIPLKNAKIGILGAGPIGLSVFLLASFEGADKIYVTDKVDERVKKARDTGATWSGNPEKCDIVKEMSLMEPLLLDAVFECCGEQEALDQAVEILKPGGKLIIIGIPPVLEKVSFSIDLLRRKEICIQNIRRQNKCIQPALDLIESRQIDIDFIITHHFSFEKTKEAFDLVENYNDGVLKAMIMMK